MFYTKERSPYNLFFFCNKYHVDLLMEKFDNFFTMLVCVLDVLVLLLPDMVLGLTKSGVKYL